MIFLKNKINDSNIASNVNDDKKLNTEGVIVDPKI
jgi:hypothetical protein